MTTILSTTDFNIGELEVEHETSTLQSESVAWKTTSLGRGLHRLKIKGKILLQNDTDIKKWESFWLSIQGKALPFILELGDDNSWSNPLYTHTQSPIAIATAAAIGQTQINITGDISTLENGCKFQIGNSTKVYTIIDINQTTKSIKVFPAFRFAYPASTTLAFSVKPKMQMTKDVTSITYGSRAKEISFECVEVME